MPELPEVAALASFLNRHAVGLRVQRADIASVQALKTVNPAVTELDDRALTTVDRHGKFLDIDFTGLHMVVHLARAGWLRWRENLPTTPLRPGRHPIAARVRFTDGTGFDLTETGPKKRLSCYLTTDPTTVPGIASLGIEPTAPEFTLERFTDIITGNRQQIKGVLRDQKTIAGIGNAYSDEILHAAKLSPFTIAATMDSSQIQRLHRAIGQTLSTAVAAASDIAADAVKSHKKDSMRVHGRTGRPCPVCGDTIRQVSYADSSLQYCPTCQTGGKPLADRRMSRLLK